MTPLSCSISSLPPIGTGDHDHRNTELLATGILGSLRYQYWLIKAMQAWQEQQPYPPCSADLPTAGSNRFSEELHKAGPVIWLFGATNWKKMFRLEIADAPKKKEEDKGQSCSARSHNKAPHHWQNVKLIFRQDRESTIFDELAEKEGFCLEKELRSLMAFVHHYGWLGAAPQNGLRLGDSARRRTGADQSAGKQSCLCGKGYFVKQQRSRKTRACYALLPQSMVNSEA